MTFQNKLLDKLVFTSLKYQSEDEIWKEIDFIDAAQSRYFISSNGNVISLCRDIREPLKPFKKGHYWAVSIGSQDYLIHRLVAAAFIDNPDNKPLVHHIDHNQNNNNVSNLQWVSYKENAIL